MKNFTVPLLFIEKLRPAIRDYVYGCDSYHLNKLGFNFAFPDAGSNGDAYFINRNLGLFLKLMYIQSCCAPRRYRLPTIRVFSTKEISGDSQWVLQPIADISGVPLTKLVDRI